MGRCIIGTDTLFSLRLTQGSRYTTGSPHCAADNELIQRFYFLGFISHEDDSTKGNEKGKKRNETLSRRDWLANICETALVVQAVEGAKELAQNQDRGQ